jgi:hypothetical protein
MEPQWYYTQSGQQLGPVSEGELRALLASGQLLPSEFVFKEGMGDWMVVSSIPEFAVVRAPPPGQPSMGSVYKEAAEIFKVHWLPLCLGIMVIIAPNLILSSLGKLLPERYLPLVDFAGVIVTAPLLLGGWMLFLNAVDRRELSVNQVWDGFERFVPALVVGLIRHSPLLPGWLFLILLPPVGTMLVLLGVLPFFALLIFLVFSFGFLADRNCSPLDAVRLSFCCVRDNFILVFVLSIMSIPLMIAGFIAVLVGMIPAGAFWLLTLAVAYRWLNPRMPGA